MTVIKILMARVFLLQTHLPIDFVKYSLFVILLKQKGVVLRREIQEITVLEDQSTPCFPRGISLWGRKWATRDF